MLSRLNEQQSTRVLYVPRLFTSWLFHVATEKSVGSIIASTSKSRYVKLSQQQQPVLEGFASSFSTSLTARTTEHRCSGVLGWPLESDGSPRELEHLGTTISWLPLKINKLKHVTQPNWNRTWPNKASSNLIIVPLRRSNWFWNIFRR